VVAVTAGAESVPPKTKPAVESPDAAPDTLAVFKFAAVDHPPTALV